MSEDELGGVPIVLLASEGAFPLAYDRRVGGRVVHLRVEEGKFVDETGSIWDERGRAVDGPIAGASLPFVPSHISEWYAWAAYHPETEIALPYGPRTGRTGSTA